MDELDLRILGSLAWKPGDPVHMARGILRPWDIARALGVHGNTVKTRLEAMRDEGVLQGLYLIPFGALQPIEVGVHWMRFGRLRDKLEGLPRLRGDPSVSDVLSFVGERARVGVLSEGGEVEAEADRLRKVAGAAETRLFYRRTFPVSKAPTLLDLRIQRALVLDALRPFSEVADEVGVSQRTVRLRFRALAEAKAFGIIPQVAIGNIRGLVAFELAVEFETPDPRRHAAVLNAFPTAFYRSVPTSENGYLHLAAATAREVEEALARAQAMPGVRAAQVLLVADAHNNPHAVLPRLDARIALQRR